MAAGVSTNAAMPPPPPARNCSQNVTGPSLVSVTCMSAPKRARSHLRMDTPRLDHDMLKQLPARLRWRPRLRLNHDLSQADPLQQGDQRISLSIALPSATVEDPRPIRPGRK